LLLADGATVPAWKLRAHCHCSRVILQPTLRRHIQRLRAAGCRIERSGGMLRYGYRLLAIPPDAMLEDLLAIVHVVRAAQPPAPIRLVAPGLGTMPSAPRLNVTAIRFTAAGAAANGR
jgi:biotin operon repressor